jgi:hypothetical protein
VGSLGVTIDDNVRARALGIEGSDLGETVAGSLSDLGAVVSAKSDIELDINVVAGLALGSEFTTGRLDEGECAAVMVRGIVAASHEDDYIGTSCVELGGNSLCRGEGGKSAKGDGVADVERHD